MRFELATAARIVFGDGVAAELPALALSIAGAVAPVRALLVTGARPERHSAIGDALRAAGLELDVVSVSGEPTVELARAATRRCLDRRAQIVIAIGGGSAIDLGKAVAALAANASGEGGGDPLAHLEVVGRGLPLARPSLPFIAVPTTSGTGAEVTRNAVLADERTHVKASLRSEHMLPRVALVDPRLTHGLRAEVTAATGMDALTQVIEPFVSHAATPITDALARDAIPRAPRALRRAFADGADADARRDLSMVSLFGGLCLANAKLGAVHGFAAPLGGALGAPHGAICARLLPLVIAANVAALRARAKQSVALLRYAEVARMLSGDAALEAEDAAAITGELVRELGIPPLSRHGLEAAGIEAIAEAAARASSMKGNPIELTARERIAILERAL